MQGSSSRRAESSVGGGGGGVDRVDGETVALDEPALLLDFAAVFAGLGLWRFRFERQAGTLRHVALSFNTSGPCIPGEHYIPPERRLDRVRRLIEERKCFTLHAGRQTGKTTSP